MNSYDVIAEAVKDYWKVNYPQDVVAFFQQKYLWDDKWGRCEELVECHGSDDYENMTFLSDFCEGQTEVKDIVIIPLREVTAFYYKGKIENHESEPQTNSDKIKQAGNEIEMASAFMDFLCIASCVGGMCKTPDKACHQCVLDWLKQEATDGKRRSL